MATFDYEYSSKGQTSQLTVNVPIPLSTSTDEFCERLAAAHHIPCFALPGLKSEMAEFVTSQETSFYTHRSQAAVDKLREKNIDRQAACSRWSDAYIKGVKSYSEDIHTIDTSFSSLYKKLIHSPSLMSILNVEHAYAMAIQDLIRDRDRTISELEKRQAAEMTEALTGGIGGRAFSDDQINTLAHRHFERLENESKHWDRELDNLKQEQKVSYLQWLTIIDEDPQQSAMKARTLSMTASSSLEDDSIIVEGHSERLEESFTIHLGAQLKTTHNLRLLSTDTLDLCKHTAAFISGQVVAEPQRLQTALSLYTHKLCGLVLLVDDRLNSYSGIKREFAAVCSQSTDFHFPELIEQLAEIEEEIIRHNESSNISVLRPAGHSMTDRSSVTSGSSESSIDSQERRLRLRIGSFYMTKHSNLAQVHTVFHLVSDDSLLCDINSRHAVILGLRNILKACFRYDIITITIPLLLTVEMTEEMTIPWCLKRAELVFKCVKGFMMEMSTWADAESRTIQFIVPKGLSVDTFNMLSNMLPNIFRQSNPIVGR